MKTLKTFEQHNDLMLNEGLFDIWGKVKGKVTSFIKSQLEKLGDKVEQLKTELEPYKGKSQEEIKSMLSSATNESKLLEYRGAPRKAPAPTTSDVVTMAFGASTVLSGVVGAVLGVIAKLGSNISNDVLGVTGLVFFGSLIITILCMQLFDTSGMDHNTYHENW